jgi:hypothetical protein
MVMTDTSSSASVGSRVPSSSGPARTESTGWVGWIVFAGVMMVTVGVLHAIQGFVALFKDDYYVVRKSGLVLQIDYTGWGWVHLILGLVVALAGLALFTGRMWARVVAIGLALLSVLANFAFMAAYPLWSITIIVVDILVIYALVVHGREMRSI